MKVLIKKAVFDREWQSRYGMMFAHNIFYEVDGKLNEAQYNSKFKDQNKFIAGEEAEAEVTAQQWKDPVTKEEVSGFIIRPERTRVVERSEQLLEDIKKAVTDIKNAVCK